MPLSTDKGEAATKSLEMKLGRLLRFLWDEVELCLLHTLPYFILQLDLIPHPDWREERRPPRATLISWGWRLGPVCVPSPSTGALNRGQSESFLFS